MEEFINIGFINVRSTKIIACYILFTPLTLVNVGSFVYNLHASISYGNS